MSAMGVVAVLLGLGVLVWMVALARPLSGKFLFFVPSINTLGDSLIGYTNQLGAFHTGHVRSAVLVLFVAVALRTVRYDRVTLPLVGFLLYIPLLLPFASDIAFSLEQYHKLFISMAMFMIAYSRVRTTDDLRTLNWGLLAAVLIGLTHFGMAQVLKLGPSTYLKDTIYFGPRGGTEVYVTYLFAYALVLFPLALFLLQGRPLRARLFYGLSVTLGLLVIALVFRRGSILAVLGGFSAYLLFAPRRRVLLRYLAGGVALLAAGFPLYGGVLIRLYTLRGDLGAYVADNERGRMAEWTLVTGEFLNNGLRHALFGSDVLNSAAYFEGDRPIHIDYLSLLVGSGAVGLALYLLILVNILWVFQIRSRAIREARLRGELRATAVALVVACAILSLSSQIWALSPLSLFFLYAGALHGIVDPTPVRRPPGRSARPYGAALGPSVRSRVPTLSAPARS